MTTQKVLNKMFILTSNLGKLAKGDFSKKARGYVTAMTSHPTYVPDLKPTVAEADIEVAKLETLHTKKGEIAKAGKANTADIKAQEKKVKKIITYEWMSQAQEALNGDESKAKELGYGVKGLDNGTSTPTIGKAKSSHAIVTKIETEVGLQHTVHLVNNETMSTILPDGVETLNFYEQIGGVSPISTDSMELLGIVKNGRYINSFQVADIGKTAFYIFCYTAKKTEKVLQMSPVFSAKIN